MQERLAQELIQRKEVVALENEITNLLRLASPSGLFVVECYCTHLRVTCMHECPPGTYLFLVESSPFLFTSPLSPCTQVPLPNRGVVHVEIYFTPAHHPRASMRVFQQRLDVFSTPLCVGEGEARQFTGSETGFDVLRSRYIQNHTKSTPNNTTSTQNNRHSFPNNRNKSQTSLPTPLSTPHTPSSPIHMQLDFPFRPNGESLSSMLGLLKQLDLNWPIRDQSQGEVVLEHGLGRISLLRVSASMARFVVESTQASRLREALLYRLLQVFGGKGGGGEDIGVDMEDTRQNIKSFGDIRGRKKRKVEMSDLEAYLELRTRG